jgi:hypothetical protein
VQREWAAKNPRATFKAPITIEDVLIARGSTGARPVYWGDQVFRGGGYAAMMTF